MKLAEKPLSAERIIGDNNRFVETAIQTLWLTNGKLMVRITEKEADELKSMRLPKKERMSPVDAAGVVPRQVGALLTYFAEHHDIWDFPCVELRTCTRKSVFVRSGYFATLVRRFPKAKFYSLSQNPRYPNDLTPVVFSLNGKCVGLVMPVQLSKPTLEKLKEDKFKSE